MNYLSPQQAHKQFEEGRLRLLDVSTPVEFRSFHATGAQLHELGTLNAASISNLEWAADHCKPLGILCKSGRRASQAAALFETAGFHDVRVVEGGTDAWAAADLPIERGQQTMSIERQVRIAAGSMVFVGVLLGTFVSPWWLILPGFVGAGLAFAGVTDTCGMGLMMARMPWNR